MTIFTRWFAKGKRRIQRRLDKRGDTITFRPQFAVSNIHYEVSDKVGAIACGGLGAIHLLARRMGLIDAIDERLHLLKFHLPYHESDHVLNFAYNALCGGVCLQDMELRRNDENVLNALGTRRIPAPTTAGDFCRRFAARDVETPIDDTRRRVWAEQPDDFFDCAAIDLDGSMAQTSGQCEARDGHILQRRLGLPSADRVAGQHQRSAEHRQSSGQPALARGPSAKWLVRCFSACAGFRKVLLRGDTDFSQTEHLDGWDDLPRVRFIYGFDALAKVVESPRICRTRPRPTHQILPGLFVRGLNRTSERSVESSRSLEATHLHGEEACPVPRSPLKNTFVPSRIRASTGARNICCWTLW